MRIFLALLLAVLPASQAMAQGAETAEQRDADFRTVIGLFQSGKAEEAVDIIDPYLAGYEKTYAGEKRLIFCADGAEEAILAMGVAQAAGKDAIVIDSGWCFALWAKGYALVDLHRVAEALPYLERAVAMMPFNAQYLCELGYAYGTLGNWEKALATFTSAVQYAEQLPAGVRTVILGRALRGEGFSLIELGRWDEAEAKFKKALALDPNDEMAKNELAYIAEKRPRRR